MTRNGNLGVLALDVNKCSVDKVWQQYGNGDIPAYVLYDKLYSQRYIRKHRKHLRAFCEDGLVHDALEPDMLLGKASDWLINQETCYRVNILAQILLWYGDYDAAREYALQARAHADSTVAGHTLYSLHNTEMLARVRKDGYYASRIEPKYANASIIHDPEQLMDILVGQGVVHAEFGDFLPAMESGWQAVCVRGVPAFARAIAAGSLASLPFRWVKATFNSNRRTA